MIHIIIGTKAQLIKMAPLIWEMNNRRLPYRLINAGQHASIMNQLAEQLGIREPDISLNPEGRNIDSIAIGLRWLGRLLYRALFKPKWVFDWVFDGAEGVCLIHGDTATTLVSLALAKRAGIKVAHIEAGLRSFNVLNPFPEELIRLIAMRGADILFAPDDWATENLRRMKLSGRIVGNTGNTIIDTLRFAYGREERLVDEPYVLMSIHRLETISSRKRLMKICQLAEQIGQTLQVVFVLHQPTKHYLERFGLLKPLENNTGVKLMALQPYLQFISLLSYAEYVISDGGSIQEETYAMGKPCLVLRTRTERLDGIGETAYLSGFDEERIQQFILNYNKYRDVSLLNEEGSPASRIVDELSAFLPSIS